MVEISLTPQVPARPAPVQRRGIERVKAILDAAEVLLGEQGYEAATLGAIGERAGIPTASIYHYFPDRYRVDAELLQRYIREVEESTTTALNQVEALTLREACDLVIDAYIACFRRRPGMAALWFAAGRSPMLVEIARAYDESAAERFWRFLTRRDLIGADTPQLVVQLAVEAGDRLFDVAFRRSATGDDATIDEARRLVTAYLETYAPPARRRAGKK
ncbi:TetR/AcrR family transcriptional regulator [Nocardia xishanensis]